MAERRMFAKSVIGSARFLKMPASARLLYYDLGMEADDDGCVEAFGVMRKTGAAEDDLRVLHSKGFIKILNDDLVTYISDWAKNNQIRKDRYHEGVYKDLILDSDCLVSIDVSEPDENKKYLTAARQKRIEAEKNSSLPYSFSYKIRQAFVGKKCPICGCTMSYANNLVKPSIQHNVPISLGGKHEIDNISVICLSCNTSIRNQSVTPPLNTEEVKRVWECIGNGAGMATEDRSGKVSIGKVSKEYIVEQSLPKQTYNYDFFKETYNKSSNLPACRSLTEKRKKAIRSFLKDFTQEQWQEVCEKANLSPFLTGKNERKWKADIDFLLRPEKAAKILEGQYGIEKKTEHKPGIEGAFVEVE